MKKYITSNMLLFVVQILFIISAVFLEDKYILWTNFLFYSTILAILVYLKEVSFSNWKKSLAKGKKFWISVLLTIVALTAAFTLTSTLEQLFPQFDSTMINLKRSNLLEVIVFGISTMILAPITEEAFFRKRLIDFRNNKWLICTTILSVFLYGVEHSLTLWGIFLASVWGLTFSISYIKTKDVYVPMTAHLILNLIGNGFTVFYAITKLM